MQTVFGDENISLGVVNWIYGVVVGRFTWEILKISIVGSRGRIRGLSVSTLSQFLLEVIKTIEKEGFQQFFELVRVFLYSNLLR